MANLSVVKRLQR